LRLIGFNPHGFSFVDLYHTLGDCYRISHAVITLAQNNAGISTLQILAESGFAHALKLTQYARSVSEYRSALVFLDPQQHLRADQRSACSLQTSHTNAKCGSDPFQFIFGHARFFGKSTKNSLAAIISAVLQLNGVFLLVHFSAPSIHDSISFLCIKWMPICPIPKMITAHPRKMFFPYIANKRKARTGSVAPATGMPRMLL
jgi:hypothetical protein